MNLPDDDCMVVTLTVDEARALNIENNDELLNAIDEAQAPVFMGDKKRTYVVIEIEV